MLHLQYPAISSLAYTSLHVLPEFGKFSKRKLRSAPFSQTKIKTSHLQMPAQLSVACSNTDLYIHCSGTRRLSGDLLGMEMDLGTDLGGQGCSLQDKSASHLRILCAQYTQDKSVFISKHSASTSDKGMRMSGTYRRNVCKKHWTLQVLSNIMPNFFGNR